MKVLLATDGRPHSDKAVNFAFNYVKAQNASLFVVFVVSPKEDESREKLVSLGMSTLEGLKKRGEDAGITVSTLLEAGSPYETILAVSDRVQADVIIVGTSGKTVLDRVLIGSVSEYVVRNARTTVIVVR